MKQGPERDRHLTNNKAFLPIWGDCSASVTLAFREERPAGAQRTESQPWGC